MNSREMSELAMRLSFPPGEVPRAQLADYIFLKGAIHARFLSLVCAAADSTEFSDWSESELESLEKLLSEHGREFLRECVKRLSNKHAEGVKIKRFERLLADIKAAAAIVLEENIQEEK